LERLETRQVIHGVINSSKPLSRQEIARHLGEAQKQEDRLTKVERDQLNFLTIEFKEELSTAVGQLKAYQTRIQRLRQNKIVQKIIPGILYQNNRNFLSWSEAPFHINFDPIFYHERNYRNAESQESVSKNFQRSSGFRVWGNFTDYLGFFIDVRDTKEWGTEKYKVGNYTLPRLGFVRATNTDHIYHDETVAYLKLGFHHLQMTYGKFSNFWGPGRTGSLILSDYATSYDQLKLEFIFNRFKFTSSYAFLIDYREQEQDVLQGKKYLAAHRLEFLPWRWLSIGLSETVMFTGRSFEPAYLNPVMFFRSAEHYLGSPDNMMMGIDFKLTLVRNFKFYGELLIDDITTTKLGTDWYGNKLGYSVGTFWVDPFKIKNMDIRMEYARIRPYVYSHADGINYTHYQSALGYWSGPNSENFYSEFNYQFSKNLLTTIFFQTNRHGANTADKNVGGDIALPHGFEDGLYIYFLDGILEKRRSFGGDISYEIFENCYFRFGYRHHSSKNILNANAIIKRISSNELIFSLGLNR
ncbi:MAG TPA: capsule assembly Wzi family protein, partial [bacterium]